MRHFRSALFVLLCLCGSISGAQVCTGLCLQQVSCPNGGTTSISGVVYAPNGIDPLPNVLVYVPSAPVAPLATGLSCPVPGAQPSGSPLVGASTAADGTFSISNMPVGTAIPLVVKIGKWRRQLVVPVTTACTDTAFSTRLPRNQSEGDIPRTAIVSSSTDQMECVLRATGVDDAEFTNPGGTGRINFYTGDANAGARVDGSTPDELSLMGNSAALNQYDMLLLPSQGTYAAPSVSSAQQFVLGNFVNAGGRAYLSRSEYPYLDRNPLIDLSQPSPPGSWWDNESTNPAPILATPSGRVNLNLAEASVMADWMQATHVTTTRGVIPFNRDTQNNILYWIVQMWFNNSTQGPYGDALQIVAHTPLSADSAPSACGRMVFNDYEIRPTLREFAPSPTFPSECASGFLSPEEKAFEYALFELTPDAGANLDPISFDFGTTPVGVATAPHTFTWTNNSDYSQTAVPSIDGADFQVVSTTCGLVAAHGACQVSVDFVPTGLRLLSGYVVVTSTGLLGTQKAFVQGTGTQDLTFNTNYLQFGTHPVGSFATLPLIAANIAPFPVPIAPLALTGDFSASSGTCGTTVPANGSCTLQVTFGPTQNGERAGTMTAPGTEPVNLEGVGGDYSLTASPATGDVEAGKLDTFTAVVTPIGGFGGSVNLVCTTDAPVTTCTVPDSVSLEHGTANATVAVRTTSKYTVPGYGYSSLRVGGRALPALAAFLPLLWAVRRRTRTLRGVLLTALLCPLLLVGLAGMSGCSSKYPDLNPAYTPAGTYTVTLSADSGGLKRSASYTLVVRQ